MSYPEKGRLPQKKKKNQVGNAFASNNVTVRTNPPHVGLSQVGQQHTYFSPHFSWSLSKHLHIWALTHTCLLVALSLPITTRSLHIYSISDSMHISSNKWWHVYAYAYKIKSKTWRWATQSWGPDWI